MRRKPKKSTYITVTNRVDGKKASVSVTAPRYIGLDDAINKIIKALK